MQAASATAPPTLPEHENLELQALRTFVHEGLARAQPDWGAAALLLQAQLKEIEKAEPAAKRSRPDPEATGVGTGAGTGTDKGASTETSATTATDATMRT